MVCMLCRHAGCEGELKENMEAIKKYIIDSVGQVDIDEIAQQISESCRADMQWDISIEQIKLHITEHMLDKKVVMSNIIRDLLRISNTTRDSCVYVDEAQNTCVDTKVLGTYLKTVDTITGIYRTVAAEKRDA